MLILLGKALGNIGAIRFVATHNLAELVIQRRVDVRATLERLLPHLILKQRQARIMLAMIDIFNRNIEFTSSDRGGRFL